MEKKRMYEVSNCIMFINPSHIQLHPLHYVELVYDHLIVNRTIYINEYEITLVNSNKFIVHELFDNSLDDTGAKETQRNDDMHQWINHSKDNSDLKSCITFFLGVLSTTDGTGMREKLFPDFDLDKWKNNNLKS